MDVEKVVGEGGVLAISLPPSAVITSGDIEILPPRGVITSGDVVDSMSWRCVLLSPAVIS